MLTVAFETKHVYKWSSKNTERCTNENAEVVYNHQRSCSKILSKLLHFNKKKTKHEYLSGAFDDVNGASET